MMVFYTQGKPFQAGRSERLDVRLGGLGRVVKRGPVSLRPPQKRGPLGVKKRRKKNVGMRKLLTLAYGFLKSGKPFDAAICATVFPVTKGREKKQQKLAPAA